MPRLEQKLLQSLVLNLLVPSVNPKTVYKQSIQALFPRWSRPMDCLTCSYVFCELHLKYSYSWLCSDFQHFPYKRDDNCYSVIKSCIHKCVSNIQKFIPVCLNLVTSIQIWQFFVYGSLVKWNSGCLFFFGFLWK